MGEDPDELPAPRLGQSRSSECFVGQALASSGSSLTTTTSLNFVLPWCDALNATCGITCDDRQEAVDRIWRDPSVEVLFGNYSQLRWA